VDAFQELIQRALNLRQNHSQNFVPKHTLSEHLLISIELLQQLHDKTSKDASLQILKQVIFTSWPDERRSISIEVPSYFNCCDELSVQNGLVFKCDRVVIPTSIGPR